MDLVAGLGGMSVRFSALTARHLALKQGG